MDISYDTYSKFLTDNGFSKTESGNYLNKIGNIAIYCDIYRNKWTSTNMFEMIIHENGEILKKKYSEYEEFESDMLSYIREERFKILLNKK